MNREMFVQRAQLLKIIAHPDRLLILKGLQISRCRVGEIQKKLGLTQSGLSQHLSKMRNAGIIVGERNGKEICYRIVDDYVLDILDVTFQESSESCV